MNKYLGVIFVACLFVGTLTGCTDYGQENIFNNSNNDNSHQDNTAPCPTCPEDFNTENLCSPSGTDVGDETCLQNGGFRECVPCSEVE